MAVRPEGRNGAQLTKGNTGRAAVAGSLGGHVHVEKIQSGQVASPDQDDPPQALSSRQAPIFLPAASDDRHKTDLQAVAIGEAYGADHYHDDISGSRWRGSFLVVMAVLALAALAAR